MTRRVEHFVRGLGDHFLTGYHEERTEEDPPEELEPHIVSRINP